MVGMAMPGRRMTSGTLFVVAVLLCVAGLVLTLYASLGLPHNEHHSFSAARGWLQFALAAAVLAFAALGAACAWRAAARRQSPRLAGTALLAAVLAFCGWILAFFG
jgi:cation transport ATPase